MSYTLYLDEERVLPTDKGEYPDARITFIINGQEITEKWDKVESITHKWLEIPDTDGCADWIDRYFIMNQMNEGQCEIDPECLPELFRYCARMLENGETPECVIAEALDMENIAGQFDYSSPEFWDTVKFLYNKLKHIEMTEYNVDMIYHYYVI